MSIVAKFSVHESAPLTNQSGRDTAMASASSKLLGLELLRFASAVAVLFYHCNHFAVIPGVVPIAQTDFPFHAWLWPLYDHGHLGVEFFWGISGYIFFWKYGQAIHAGSVSATRFFWLRFSRLYPLHFVTLILVAGLQVVHRRLTGGDYAFPSDDIGQFLRQLLLATDWGPPVARSFNGPIWSISAEIAVYAAFFLLLRKFGPSARLCISIVLAGLILQLAGLGWASIGCATFFFVGGLATMAPKGATRPAVMVLVGLLLLCASTDLPSIHNMMPLVLLVAVPSLLILVSRDWAILTRSQRMIQAAGNLTYSSYLLHFPLQLMFAVAVAWSGIMPDLAHPAFLLAYLALVMVAGAICYRRFELPAQNWIRRRMPKASAAV